MIEIGWPADPGGRLLWAQMVAVWLVTLYAFPPGPYGQEEATHLRGAVTELRRWRAGQIGVAVVAGLIVAVLPGLRFDRLIPRAACGGLIAVAGVILPLLRLRWTAAGRARAALAVDLAAVPAVGLALGILVDAARLVVSAPLLVLPMSGEMLAAAALVGGAAFYLTQGGTHVVRGILDSITVKPSLADGPGTAGSDLDEPEYNRGRVIGNLERILLAFFALLGSYPAMAVVVAAKGLVRWSDFRDRDFAEYFLVGSLASLLLALAVGALLREVLL